MKTIIPTFEMDRRPSHIRVSHVLVKALAFDNSYRDENEAAIHLILTGYDLDKLPHTWGAASLKARIDKLKPWVFSSIENEKYCRFYTDTYLYGSYCSI